MRVTTLLQRHAFRPCVASIRARSGRSRAAAENARWYLGTFPLLLLVAALLLACPVEARAEGAFGPKDIRAIYVEGEFERYLFVLQQLQETYYKQTKATDDGAPRTDENESELFNIVHKLLSSHNKSESLQLVERGLALLSKIGGWTLKWGHIEKGWIQALLLLKRGHAYLQDNGFFSPDDVDAAVEALEAAARIVRAGTSWRIPDYVTALGMLGDARLLRFTHRGIASDIDIAIQAYEDAVREERMINSQAALQMKLGMAYRARVNGDRPTNLKRSLAALIESVRVRRQHTFPLLQLLLTQSQIARTRFELGDLSGAEAGYDEAIESFYLYLGYHVLQSQKDSAVVRGAPVFADAAFVALSAGKHDRAVDLLSRGKAILPALYFLKERTLRDAPLTRAQYISLRAKLTELARAQAQLKDKPAGDNDLSSQLWAETYRTEQEARKLILPEIGEESFRHRQDLYALLEELSVPAPANATWKERVERESKHEELDRLKQLTKKAVDTVIGEEAPGSKIAREHVPDGGAIVMPMLSAMGGRILILTRSGNDLKVTILKPEGFNDNALARTFGIARLRRPAPEGSPKVPQATTYFEKASLQHFAEVQGFGEWHAALLEVGSDLWSSFVKDLDAGLMSLGVKEGSRIIIIPSGALGLLPIGLASPSIDAMPFGERFELVTVPSLESLQWASAAAQHNRAPSLALIVNPAWDDPDSSFFSEIGGALVWQHFTGASSSRLDKMNADPGTILAALSNRTHWHFATHGFYSWKDPSKSGLKARRPEDAFFLNRLAEMEATLGSPRLVVLAACESGLYDAAQGNDESYGLPTAFIQLGAGGVVGSLWKVDDLATMFLMARFYELQFAERLEPPAALRRAQLWLRDATKKDLIAYAKASIVAAKLSASIAEEIRLTLMEENPGDGDNCFAASRSLREQSGDQSETSAVAKLHSRPYAHPLCWAGFVYTGL